MYCSGVDFEISFRFFGRISPVSSCFIIVMSMMPHTRQTCHIKSHVQAVNGRWDLELLRHDNFQLLQCVFVVPHKTFILMLFIIFLFCGCEQQSLCCFDTFATHLSEKGTNICDKRLQRRHKTDRPSHVILVV